VDESPGVSAGGAQIVWIKGGHAESTWSGNVEASPGSAPYCVCMLRNASRRLPDRQVSMFVFLQRDSVNVVVALANKRGLEGHPPTSQLQHSNSLDLQPPDGAQQIRWRNMRLSPKLFVAREALFMLAVSSPFRAVNRLRGLPENGEI
jgi:hypothetical protein